RARASGRHEPFVHLGRLQASISATFRGADHTRVIGIAVVLCTLASYAIAWLVGIPVLVPILNTAASFPFMVAGLRRGDLRLAVPRMLVWALTMGVAATLLSYAQPSRPDTLFLRGEAYRTEMFAWVMTGRGAESSPARFIPQHGRDAAIFCAL